MRYVFTVDKRDKCNVHYAAFLLFLLVPYMIISDNKMIELLFLKQCKFAYLSIKMHTLYTV